MTWICFRGLEVTARVQYVLLAVEVVVLVAFAAVWNAIAPAYFRGETLRDLEA